MRKILFVALSILSITGSAMASMNSYDTNLSDPSPYFQGHSFRSLIEFGLDYINETQETKLHDTQVASLRDLMDKFGVVGSRRQGMGMHPEYYNMMLFWAVAAAGERHAYKLAMNEAYDDARHRANRAQLYRQQVEFAGLGIVNWNAYESKHAK